MQDVAFQAPVTLPKVPCGHANGAEEPCGQKPPLGQRPPIGSGVEPSGSEAGAGALVLEPARQ